MLWNNQHKPYDTSFENTYIPPGWVGRPAGPRSSGTAFACPRVACGLVPASRHPTVNDAASTPGGGVGTCPVTYIHSLAGGNHLVLKDYASTVVGLVCWCGVWWGWGWSLVCWCVPVFCRWWCRWFGLAWLCCGCVLCLRLGLRRVNRVVPPSPTPSLRASLPAWSVSLSRTPPIVSGPRPCKERSSSQSTLFRWW